MPHSLTQLALYIRVGVALFTRTFFQPDEYFQSLEPAHNLVFGYGHLTWEWMIPQPIRSIIYPALNVPVYYLLKITRLSEVDVIGDAFLIAWPRILHGCLAACTDIYLGKTAQFVLGSNHVSTVMFISLTCFFNALALSRSLSNSLETSLCTVAFSFYPWDAHPKLSPELYNSSKLKKMVIFSAMACMIRPTNAVIWVYLYGNLVWANRHSRRNMVVIINYLLAVSLASLTILAIVDSLYYGTPTFTPLNFLKRNMSNVSLFYGANPWHYYATQAIPILCTTALPFVLHGMWKTATSTPVHNTPLRTMLTTIIWTIAIYSLAGHKEWRFLHPILPLLHIFAAKSVIDLSFPSRRLKIDAKTGKSSRRTAMQGSVEALTIIHRQFQLPNIPVTYIGSLLCTLPVSLYIVLFYCSGPVSVPSYIRAIPRHQLNATTIGVLMPCHSIPGHAYIHRKELANGRMWSLGCEPPLHGEPLATYKDQTNVFFDSPIDYLRTYFPANVNESFPLSEYPASLPGTSSFPSVVHSTRKYVYQWQHEWPTHLIIFGSLLQEEGVQAVFEANGYKEVWKAGRDWEGEGMRKGGARVWKWSKNNSP